MAVRRALVKTLILAGGLGTRLGLTDRPKPMVPIAGRPLLEWIVDCARRSGLDDLIMLTGHLGDVIERHFGDGSDFGVRVQYVREEGRLGTAGAVRAIRGQLDEAFVVLYGDLLVDVDLARMVDFHHRHGGVGTLLAHANNHPHDSDLLRADPDGRITAVLPKPHPAGLDLPNLVSGAVYVLEPAAIDHVPDGGESDWGRDVFAQIVAAGEALYAYRSFEYAKDVGTPDRLAQGEADIESGRMAASRSRRPAVFFDRDGVLNREIYGVHRPEDLELLPGAAEALARVNAAGVPAICITNQPDVAKGMMTEETLRRILEALDSRLAEQGAHLDEVRYCPHHPERGHPGENVALKIDCDCRKPKPGMILAAAADHDLDLERSWMIGDRYVDVGAAHAAGARVVLVQTGHGGTDRDLHAGREADFVADSVVQAVDYILKDLA